MRVNRSQAATRALHFTHSLCRMQALHVRRQQFSDAEVFEIMRQIAAGLAYLHSEGITHRDVKPANILIQTSTEHSLPQVKLSDFGCSRARSTARSTNTGTVSTRGTWAYMAPEVMNPRDVSTDKADVYSLGMVWWELLTRQQPFANLEHVEIVTEVLVQRGRPEVRIFSCRGRSDYTLGFQYFVDNVSPACFLTPSAV